MGAQRKAVQTQHDKFTAGTGMSDFPGHTQGISDQRYVSQKHCWIECGETACSQMET